MIPVIDLHADTYMKKDIFNTLPWIRKAYFKLPSDQDKEVQFSEDITTETIIKGNVRIQTQSLFIGQLGITNPLHNGLKMLANIKRDIKANPSLYQYYSIDDYYHNKDKYGNLISIEGLELIANDLDMLDIFYELGVRILAPTWNRALPYVGSAVEPYGILDKGRLLADKINELNLIFDVSHISDQGFWDYLDILEVPIIASHSNYRKVVPHERNLSEDMIKEIDDRGGVMGLNFYPGFMETSQIKIYPDYPTGYSAIYNMLDAVVSDFGDDVLAFGSDFDGISKYLDGVKNPSFYQDFAVFLRERNVSETTIEKLFYKNALRVLEMI
ncbi:membrane dipeptidase [bacterium]|nr:membrane dipeptidase [bacterium]